jgi:predicted nucleotidyltransferase
MVADERRVAPYHDVEIPLDELEELCRAYHVRELAVFGSVPQDDFLPKSDVDVLVEFEPGARIGLFEYDGLQEELEALLDRTVDLVEKTGLKRLSR